MYVVTVWNHNAADNPDALPVLQGLDPTCVLHLRAWAISPRCRASIVCIADAARSTCSDCVFFNFSNHRTKTPFSAYAVLHCDVSPVEQEELIAQIATAKDYEMSGVKQSSIRD